MNDKEVETLKRVLLNIIERLGAVERSSIRNEREINDLKDTVDSVGLRLRSLAAKTNKSKVTKKFGVDRSTEARYGE